MDLAKLRAETPGMAHCINLNNAGASLMPLPVISAQQDHIELESRIGGQAAALEQSGAIETTSAAIARLLNADPQSIALTTNATRAWQLAFYGLSFKEGDRILTSRVEYGSNYVGFLQMQKRTGLVIDVIPDDESGASDPEALEAMIDDRVKLIAVTWVPTNGGLINPAAALGTVARSHGIPYLLDACQAIGQMPADVTELGCDFLCATGRKWLRAPRGTGFLYAAPAMLDRVEPALLDHAAAPLSGTQSYQMRPSARRYETYDRSFAAILGLGAAVEYALDLGLDTIYGRVSELASHLRDELAARPGICLRDLGTERCGIVTFTHERHSAIALRERLADQTIQVSVSSPDGAPLDSEARALTGLVRVSPHYYNSREEIGSFLSALDALIEQPANS